MAETAETLTPATEQPVISEKTDPWTSQSATAETPAVDPTPDPAETAESPIAGSERDDKGQFTGKKPSKRTNPYEAVKAATGETAKERELRQVAEARADAAERKLADAARQSAPARAEAKPATQSVRTKPSEEEVGGKYATYADFMEDLADWKLEQRFAAEDFDARIEQRFRVQQDRRDFQAFVADIHARGRAAYPDFQDKLNVVLPVQFTPQQATAILQAPGSEHIQYAIASDPEVAKRIAAIDNPMLLGLEFAKLLPSSGEAARPDSSSMARPSSAKPPINRVGGTAHAVPVDPDDLDFGPEYIRVENEREKKRQQANRW